MAENAILKHNAYNENDPNLNVTICQAISVAIMCKSMMCVLRSISVVRYGCELDENTRCYGNQVQ